MTQRLSITALCFKTGVDDVGSSQTTLVITQVSVFRHEIYRGEVFAMAGATEAHNLISGI